MAVWKLQNFSVTQILREIEYHERGVCHLILTHLGAQNNGFLNNLNQQNSEPLKLKNKTLQFRTSTL